VPTGAQSISVSDEKCQCQPVSMLVRSVVRPSTPLEKSPLLFFVKTQKKRRIVQKVTHGTPKISRFIFCLKNTSLVFLRFHGAQKADAEAAAGAVETLTFWGMVSQALWGAHRKWMSLKMG